MEKSEAGPSDDKKLKRLIVIDGANFMHGCKYVAPFITLQELLPNALPLALLVIKLIKKGHNVRVCLLRNYTEQNVLNYYALRVLMSANLTIEPLLSGKELDDEALLSIADEFSACIITNDNYNNHKNRLPVPVDRLIKFEPVDPSYDRAVLRDRKLFKRPQAACKLLPSSESIYSCSPGDAAYKKVLKSFKRFPPPNERSFNYIHSFGDYIYDFYHMMMYMDLPDNHFIDHVSKFKSRYVEYYQLWMEHKYQKPFSVIQSRFENERKLEQLQKEIK